MSISAFVCFNAPYTPLEVFEDTKGVIRICKSKKDRQHNGKKDEMRK